MSFCLPQSEVNKFKQALIDGVINPGELADMSSAERRSFFEKIVGESDAKETNALFESKLLLKNQEQGMVNWVKQLTGMKANVKADILSKINRLGSVLDPADRESFLNDLVNKRLGVDVTADEAKRLLDFSKNIEAKKAEIPVDAPVRSTARMEYGTEYAKYREYIEGLKTNAKALSMSDYFKSGDNFAQGVKTLAGNLKSIAASLDNSFFGRQGLKTLMTNPDIWASNFAKSFGDISKGLKGQDAMLPVKADIASRPNALNGLYDNSKLAVGLRTEEAFPQSAPEKIPALGRLFKASEDAYNAAALRMRADLADRMFTKAEKMGIDLTDKQQATSIGKLVNSMTGRGDIGKLEAIGDTLNSAFFSVRFLKSNFDTLTAHVLDGDMSSFAKKQAAMNLLKVVGTTAGVLTLANILFPGSVDLDPRSSQFGKIKIGANSFDITGGMGSLVTLASRIIPTTHNGKLGWYEKSGNKYTEIGTGKFGNTTPLDVLFSFGEGKASPIVKPLIDVMRRSDFNGNIPTVGSEAQQALTPIPIQTIEQLKGQDAGDQLLAILSDSLGFSVSTPKQKKHK